MKKLLLSLAILSLSFSACQLPWQTTTEGPLSDTTQDTPTGNTVENDRAMEITPETANYEWKLDESSDVIRYSTTVTNPSTGAQLAAYLDLPSQEGPFPVVLIVPGGITSGSENIADGQYEAIFLKEGIAVAYFDADGRGNSTGEEDYNGYDGQNGLLAVSQALEQSEWIDPEEMGLVSFSYGTTMASGMLARYAEEQPFEWYVDWEGPSAREYITVGCRKKPVNEDAPGLNHDCEDDKYWSERESVGFLPDILIPYWRIQGENDHVQKVNQHAIDAINAAASGSSPWTRINYETPNQSFDQVEDVEYIQGSGSASHEAAIDAALELFETY